MQPPADVLARVTGSEGEPTAPPVALETVIVALVPIIDSLRVTLSDIGLIGLHEATLTQRSQLATLYDEIDRAVRDATTWRDAILYVFRDAGARMGAREIPMADGVVKLEPPRDEWNVDVPSLQRALKDLVGRGLVAQAEYDQVFSTTVSTKADGAKLNALARNRGDEVKEAIEAHRTKVPGNPMSAKVRFVRTDR